MNDDILIAFGFAIIVSASIAAFLGAVSWLTFNGHPVAAVVISVTPMVVMITWLAYDCIKERKERK